MCKEKVIRNIFARILVIVYVLMVMTCGGTGGEEDNSTCESPAVNSSGSWLITETATENNCDEGPADPYILEITQSGNDIS